MTKLEQETYLINKLLIMLFEQSNIRALQKANGLNDAKMAIVLLQGLVDDDTITIKQAKRYVETMNNELKNKN